jgi:hypothetical protein
MSTTVLNQQATTALTQAWNDSAPEESPDSKSFPIDSSVTCNQLGQKQVCIKDREIYHKRPRDLKLST